MASTLCAIVKNEAPYLLEWTAFHRLIGFDRIVVYENDSTDSTPEGLEGLLKIGAIDAWIPWRNIAGSPQFLAYRDAALTCPTDWLMFLDADEFLNLKSQQKVNDFLAGFPPEVSCVAVNWRIFGSSGAMDLEPGLVVERFIRASRQSDAVNRHLKSFFRPKCARAVHMHAPTMGTGASVVASGAPLKMETLGLSDGIDWSAAQVNHYFTKSRAEYEIKRARGIAHVASDDPEKFTCYTDEMFAAHDLNDEIDESLTWILPALREKCAEWSLALRANAAGSEPPHEPIDSTPFHHI